MPRESIAGATPYDALFTGGAAVHPVTSSTIAEFFRCSMGLSAWKEYRSARWALRVNPSSGNLHPTEAYLIQPTRVAHYAPREHALEERCLLRGAPWPVEGSDGGAFLVAITSIHWREAWKYGERAFRYCQHDAGHAIAALRFAAALLGWRFVLLPQWTDAQLSAVLGLDRAGDFAGAELEEPECVGVVTPGEVDHWLAADPERIVEAARAGRWAGRANALSPTRVEWPIIDEVANATRRVMGKGDWRVRVGGTDSAAEPTPQVSAPAPPITMGPVPEKPARQIILQRRSAVAFDARSSLPRRTFMSMLERTKPALSAVAQDGAKAEAPWDAIDWPPQVHLLIFVHRVDGLTPGVYAYMRDPSVTAEWRTAMRSEFLWEPMNDSNDSNDPNDSNDSNDSNGLFLLLPFDVGWVANRVSCDQDIAADGFFSLGMIARLESSLKERGDWFYRRLFWECGMLGQVLYLEAEAAGARATGIGCFYDNPVHEAAGLSGLEWQSLYHFSMGVPVEDDRLTTEPGYEWE